MKKNRWYPFNYVIFSSPVAMSLLIGYIVLGIILLVISNLEIIQNNEVRRMALETTFNILLLVGIALWIIGIVDRKILTPLHELQNAIDEVSKGNFDVNIKYDRKDQFGEVVKCFNQMVVELNGIQTMRNDFLNTFSHECKTPIVSIRGFAKQLKRDELTEAEKHEYLDIIISESNRLTHLYQNILALSRYKNQEFVTNQEAFCLDEQIRQCIILCQREWLKKNIELDIQLESIQYFGNKEMLKQVWINVLGNAIKFSKQNGKINIQCISTDSEVITTIEDYGVGMDQESIPYVFDMFFVVKPSNGNVNGNGNGIGLAVVKRIIDLYKGDIKIYSELEIGTKVVIRLPKTYEE